MSLRIGLAVAYVAVLVVLQSLAVEDPAGQAVVFMAALLGSLGVGALLPVWSLLLPPLSLFLAFPYALSLADGEPGEASPATLFVVCMWAELVVAAGLLLRLTAVGVRRRRAARRDGRRRTGPAANQAP